MIRHLTRIDGRCAIFIEDAILELLGIDEQTPLEVKTDGTGLIIRPRQDGAPTVLPTAAPAATEPAAAPEPPVAPPAPTADAPDAGGLDEDLFGDDDVEVSDAGAQPLQADDLQDDDQQDDSADEQDAFDDDDDVDMDDIEGIDDIDVDDAPAAPPVITPPPPPADAEAPELSSDLDGDLMGALDDAFDTPAPSEDDAPVDDSIGDFDEDLDEDDLKDLPPLSNEGEALGVDDDDDDLFGDDVDDEDEDPEAGDLFDDVPDDDESEESLSSDLSSESDEEPMAAAPPPPAPPQPAAPPAPDDDDDASIPDADAFASSVPDEPAAAEVVVFLQGDEIARTPLRGPRMIIGRESKADIHLDHRALSRKHAAIEKRGAAIWVQDLGSANKTYVNGDMIEEPVRLHQGDTIQVGHYEIVLEGVEQAAANTPVVTLDGPEGCHRFAMVGGKITIGRAQACDIAIAHKSISRRHLTITVDGNAFIVEDLGSQNGVTIDGERIEGPTRIDAGEPIEICEFSLVLGFLEDEDDDGGDAAPRKESTMLIDRRSLAKAAYVDGDFENVKSAAVSVGGGGKEGGTAKGKARKR